MSRHSRTLASVAIAAAMLTGAAGAASAHMVSGHAGHMHMGHFGHHFHGRHGGVFVGFGDFDDGYAYGGGCRYLRYKAHETGRPYWWHRYHECIDG